MAFFERLGAFVLDLLFPTTCASCASLQRNGVELCTACFARVSVAETLFCPVCLSRQPQGAPPCHASARFRFGAPTTYTSDAIRTLIRRLKFASARKAAEPLGDFLNAYLIKTSTPFPCDAIVPVPLGRRRERTRGFNQAALIAAQLGKRRGLPVLLALRRTRETDAQTLLSSKEQRQKNIAGCFLADRSLVEGKHVILVDDVRTTGATIREAAWALRAAGARSVLALTVARA